MLVAARTAAWAKNGSPTPAAYGGLRFTAEADNSTVQLTAVGSAPAVTLVKSFDGVNWEDYAVGEVIDLPSIGDFVYLAAGEGGNIVTSSCSTAVLVLRVRQNVQRQRLRSTATTRCFRVVLVLRARQNFQRRSCRTPATTRCFMVVLALRVRQNFQRQRLRPPATARCFRVVHILL